jgi:hypothetical protein
MRSPMRAAFVLYFAMLCAALLAALPLATLSAAARLPAAPVFDLVDRNKDGFIDRRESESVPGLAERFEKMDRDGDGKLDRVEFARW